MHVLRAMPHPRYLHGRQEVMSMVISFGFFQCFRRWASSEGRPAWNLRLKKTLNRTSFSKEVEQLGCTLKLRLISSRHWMLIYVYGGISRGSGLSSSIIFELTDSVVICWKCWGLQWTPCHWAVKIGSWQAENWLYRKLMVCQLIPYITSVELNQQWLHLDTNTLRVLKLEECCFWAF